MVPVLFWILFAITCAFIAWGFLRMLYETLRGTFTNRGTTRPPSDTGGTSGGSIDVSPGFTAESSGSDSGDASGSDSGSESSGGGDYGGGGASGGWS